MNWSIENLGQTASPSVYPVTTDEAKEWLRDDYDNENNLISRLIRSATKLVELYTGRSIMSQSYRLNMDCFPDVIQLPMPPLVSVTNVKYIDESGVLQTLSDSLYEVDAASFPARIVPAYSQSWPTHLHTINSVRVEFVAGYGETSDDIPEPIIDAILAYVVDRSEKRGIEGTLSYASQQLLNPYKTWYSLNT